MGYPSVYYNTQGDTDQTILPVLSTITPGEYEQMYSFSWANSMLPYHPEYNELVFAQTYLQPAYNWLDNFNLVTTYNIASDSGFTTSANIISHDLFFRLGATLSNTDSSLMHTYITSNWQNNQNMWQFAYSSVEGDHGFPYTDRFRFQCTGSATFWLATHR